MSDSAIEYARQLISFPTPSSDSNVQITEHLEAIVAQWGFTTELVTYPSDGQTKASLIAKKGEGSAGFAYFGHTDVVPAVDWRESDHGPFQPVIEGGRLYGRGSCDMKGSIACMLAALQSIADRDLRSPCFFVCTSDEEVGFLGAKAVVNQSAIYQQMLQIQPHTVVGEPTRLQIVHAHKGSLQFQVTARGFAAHSSSHRGDNANWKLIPFLAELQRTRDQLHSDPQWCDPAFDPPHLSMNLIMSDGNPALNVTSAFSECRVYLRPMPQQDPEQLLRRFRDMADRHGLDFQPLFAPAQALYTDPQTPYIHDLCQLANVPKAMTVCYGTDGAVLTGLQKLAVVGPGDIAQAHTRDEWIALDQLDAGTALYSRFLQQWCLSN